MWCPPIHSSNDLIVKTHTVLIRSFIALSLVTPVFAEEGGASRYVPGNTATLIDLPPTKPGWVA